MTRPKAFVHTDDAQLLPALVAIHALRSRGGGGPGGTFDVGLLRLEGSVLDGRRDGQAYRARGPAVWDHQRASAFHYLRRSVPELLGYRGRALVTDPDVFAVRSVVPLMERDMAGRAVHCRFLPGGFGNDGNPCYSTGVMLLDCANLRSWRWHEEVEALFSGKLDYWDMLALVDEARETIGELGEAWNSFDTLGPDTALVHFTRLSTQPWSVGLPFANERYDPTMPVPDPSWWQRLLGIEPRRYGQPHPDPAQERLFFDLLAECLKTGLLPSAYVHSEVKARRMRRDVWRVLARSGFRESGRDGDALLDEFGIAESVAPRR